MSCQPFPPPGTHYVSYSPTKNISLHEGWVFAPDGRGTFDISRDCLLTIFLCSWQILCLNLPAKNDKFRRRFWRKYLWTLLTVLGPEVVFQRSLGEWLLARRAVHDFEKLGRGQVGWMEWTETHSFYANMGGIVLVPPDSDNCERFPVNSAQLHFLVEGQYIDYPIVSRKTIKDKNKVDWTLRALILLQTLWFSVNCLARIALHLPLTTLEVSTLAFIIPAAGTSFCWRLKPMDVESPTAISLKPGVTISQIRSESDVPPNSWRETPLEFVDKSKEWPWNIYWRYGLVFWEKKANLRWLILNPKSRPIERIADDYWPKPSLSSLPYLFFFHVAYAAILVAGWNLDMPTKLELRLWRIACLIQLVTICSAWFTMPFQIIDESPRWLERVYVVVGPVWNKCEEWCLRYLISKERVETIKTLGWDDPDWEVSVLMLLVYEFTWGLYLVARLYIIVEDFVSLRAMPPDAFKSVNWTGPWPHL
ncbi:hypothetical protein EJ08DRAFT_653807 [Tothia fuscella]|uniref:Uncharacterized protein n=1 Tax=Tothia fuscella TaxID=1048955 RepID=A0A9P4NGA2_9PEZI|nr:hypothetical protein EJ08DRAFT_653807 [Tothia fuscella]